MNRLVSLLVLICLTSFVYAGGPGQGAAIHTLVIDPGHGGMDPGAIGPGGHHESELALAVSLKFGEMVKEAFPDMKIIYTRTTDKFVSLADRADMANKAKADLFICIHLNSATNHEAYGTSTYVLGLHRTDDNLEIAKRENAVIDLEVNKDKKYEFDPNTPEGHIIMSMKQNAFLDQSILIASKIEDELAVLSKRKSRGVKQAGFWVLYKTAMPSLLAEIGFISNPNEENYLAADAGQTNIATSIYKAFRAYKFEIEGRKDTPVIAMKEPVKEAAVAEKKKEQLTEQQQQPAIKTAPANPTKQSQELAEAAKQAANPATEQKAQPSQSVTSLDPQPKREEKAWEPDTSAYVAPAASVFREQQAVANIPVQDNVTTTLTKDTLEVKPKPATTPEPVAKKLVPLRTGNEPPVKKEEPKPVVKDEPVAKKETAPPVVVKKDPATPVAKDEPKPTVRQVKEETKAVVKAKEPVKSKIDTIKKVTAEVKTTAPKPGNPPATARAKTDTVKTVTAKKEPVTVKKQTPVVKETAAAKKEVNPIKPVAKKEIPVPAVDASDERVVFTVQIFAAHKPPKNYDELVSTFGLMNREEIGDGVVRYMAGQYSHYKEAEKTLAIAKAKGFPTAFIICYLGDVRQDIKKTREIGLRHP